MPVLDGAMVGEATRGEKMVEQGVLTAIDGSVTTVSWLVSSG